MNDIEATGDNAQQITFWNGEAGNLWSQRNDEMDRMLRPLGAQAIESSAVRAGEFVLDIGCGCGGTTLDLALAVGDTGHVLGVDVSAPMLAKAESVAQQGSQEHQGRVSFQLSDASSVHFRAAAYDLLFSRFGVMFFSDPVSAFSNMRQALKTGGRLTFLCWGPADQNEWIMVPMKATREHLPAREPMDPKAPGPFAFADTTYVNQVLESAGFTDVSFEATTPEMRIGDGKSPDKAVDFFMELGPVAGTLKEQPDSVRALAREAIKSVVDKRYENGFVCLQAKCWIVSAKNP